MITTRTIIAKYKSVDNRVIQSTHVFGRYLYVGAGPEGIVYRTLDGTSNLEFYKVGDMYATAIADYGNALFVGTSPNGRIMMHNFNTGNRFHYVTTGDYKVTAFEVHDNKLYAGTSPSGLILSFDGTDWRMEYDAYGGGIKAMVSHGGSLYVFVEGIESIPVLNSSGWSMLKDGDDFFSISTFSKVTTSLATLEKNENFDVSFSCAVSFDDKLYFAPENRCNLYEYDGTDVKIAGQWEGEKIRSLDVVGADQLLVAVDDMVYIMEGAND